MAASPESAVIEPSSDSVEGATFYVHKDGVQYGPDSAANLHALYVEGWLLPDDLVWQEGQPEWQAAALVFAPIDIEPEEEDFAIASAVQLTIEKPWPWGSIGIAVVVHVALLFLAVKVLQLYPIKFSEDTTPVSQEPPLEVAMIPESEPAPPPPPPVQPADPTPPPPEPTPPPVADLPPPPPAPPLMPVLTPPLPTIEPVVPEPVADTSPEPPQPPVHHKMAKPVVRPVAPVVADQSPPPLPVENLGEPEYLANPRPEYPISARIRHQEGTVLLQVNLNAAGDPIGVSVEQSSGVAILDQVARKKVAAEWRFKPGQGSIVHVPVEFHLNE